MGIQASYPLAGFEDELDRIESLREHMEEGSADYRFLNYCAPGGFAKSHLMDRILEEYGGRLPVCLVRVDEFLEVEPFDRNSLLRQILLDFSQRMAAPPPAGHSAETDPHKLAAMIIELMTEAKKEFKISMLLFDDYDRLPMAESRWIEQYLLNPLAGLQSVAFILTSEYALSFNDDFDFRLRLEISEITTMTVGDIIKTFPEYQALAQEFYDLSGGIVALVIGLRELCERMGIDAENYPQRQADFKRRYFDQVVAPKILQKFSPHTQEMLRIVVLLRRFDIRVVNNIVKGLPELGTGFDDQDFFDLIRDLGSTVQWKKGEYGYVFNPALRKVLQEMVHFSDEEFFKRVNKLAIEAFRSMLKESYREHFLVELVYHSIVVNHFKQLPGDASIEEKVADEILRFLNDEAASNMYEDDLDSLRNALDKDSEIRGYITPGVLEAITRDLRTRLIENRVLAPRSETTAA